MYLIGITGRKYSGKDTAFRTIKSWAEGRHLFAERQGFADKLKLSALRCFKPDASMDEALEWADALKIEDPLNHVAAQMFEKGQDQLSEFRVSGREFLQNFGTEAHRDVFDPDFWVNALLPTGYADPLTPKWWKNFEDDTIFAVITDVRFPNEAQRIKELGGVIFEIHRGGDPTGDTHSSETPLPADLVDQTIYNSGSLVVFDSTVRAVMDERFREVRVVPSGVYSAAGDPLAEPLAPEGGTE